MGLVENGPVGEVSLVVHGDSIVLLRTAVTIGRCRRQLADVGSLADASRADEAAETCKNRSGSNLELHRESFRD